MQIPLVAGRLFNDGDTATSPRVVVIDQYLVKRYFADASPLGQQIQRGGPTARRSPSSASSARSTASTSASRSRRSGSTIRSRSSRAPSMALVVKTGIDPQTLVPQVRAAVAAIDPEQPIADVRTMDEWMARSLESAAHADDAAGAVRRRRAGAVGDRHLRRAGVRRRAARRASSASARRSAPIRASILVAGAGAGHAHGRHRRSCSAWSARSR